MECSEVGCQCDDYSAVVKVSVGLASKRLVMGGPEIHDCPCLDLVSVTGRLTWVEAGLMRLLLEVRGNSPIRYEKAVLEVRGGHWSKMSWSR